jgi:aminopeptidase 2
MLNDYVGSECFVAGLRNYLKAFKYANASSDDLWNELDKAAPNKNVKSLMQIWTKEKGYPKIKVYRFNGN